MLSPAAGLLVDHKYVLEGPLARGGMGSVWTAIHRELGVRVAVKFMDPDVAAAGGGARFEREAKAAAHLDSRHVVQIRDYGLADGTPYLVMELLKGESLEQRLTRRRRLPFLETLNLLRQLAKGLRQAHESGIVHRDLKPGNIFIASVDDEEVVKLLDFGIAKVSRVGADANATRTGMLMGSVHYASPEQLRSSKDADVRSDVWSVGVILFRMIVGVLPFRGSEIADIIVKVCAEPIPRPSSIVADLPSDVDAFFGRVLVRNPAERFQTVAELVNAFTLVAERGATVPVAGHTSRESVGQLVVVTQAPLEPSTLQIQDAPPGERTVLWEPQQNRPVGIEADPSINTLRGPGVSSTTAKPPRVSISPGQAPKPLLVAGAFLLLLGVVAVSVLFLRREPDRSVAASSAGSTLPTAVTASSPLAVPSTAPPGPAASSVAIIEEQPQADPQPAVSIPIPPITAPPVVPALRAEASSGASGAPRPPPSQSAIAIPTKAPSPPVTKKPTARPKDDDVDMP